MQFRTILEGLFSSPITVVSSVVIIVCASVLVVNVSSTIITSSDMNDASIDETRGFPAGSSNNSLKLQQGDAVPKVTINREQSRSDRETLKSNYQQRSQGSGSSRGYSNRNSINSDSRAVKENHNSYKRNAGYDDFSELPTAGNTGSSDDISRGASTLNFSNSNSTVGIDVPGAGATSTTSTTSATSNNDSSETNTSSAGSATTSGVGADLESEKVFPVSSESTVKIDLDEIQTISCRPVTENGPPCMCTITITDANGSFSEVLNNCN